MDSTHRSSSLRLFAGYYGVLQSFHLILLARAGWLTLKNQPMPFPAPPPMGGWPDPALPFLIGMGVVDVFAIMLGLVFVYFFFVRKEVKGVLGLISLTGAVSSGIVYLIGTAPSGAWGVNAAAYLAVFLLFSPIIPLYYFLIKHLMK